MAQFYFQNVLILTKLYIPVMGTELMIYSTLKCKTMCCCIEFLLSHASPQILHSKGYFSTCCCWCFCIFPFWVKPRPHTGHLYGRSPVWAFIWFFKLLLVWAAYGHKWHLYGRLGSFTSSSLNLGVKYLLKTKMKKNNIKTFAEKKNHCIY